MNESILEIQTRRTHVVAGPARRPGQIDCRANLEQISQSRQDSGLVLSHFQGECLKHNRGGSILGFQVGGDLGGEHERRLGDSAHIALRHRDPVVEPVEDYLPHESPMFHESALWHVEREKPPWRKTSGKMLCL